MSRSLTRQPGRKPKVKVKIKIKTMSDNPTTHVFDVAGDKQAETNEDNIGDDLDIGRFLDTFNSDSASKIG